VAFAEVTLPVAGVVSGVSAFAADQVAVAVYESSTRLVLRVRENGTWRAAPWPAGGSKQGVPYARSATDVYMLATDLVSPFGIRIAHHDGMSWATVSDGIMRPTALVGSSTSLIAFEHDLSAAWSYEGSAWITLPVFAGTLAVNGPRHDAVFATNNPDQFRSLVRFDGLAWTQEAFARGRAGAVPRGAMYSADPNPLGTSSRLWPFNTATGAWGNNITLPIPAREIAEWVGVLGTNDVFLQQLVSNVPHYVHWPGTTNPVTLETTNLPDGTVLDAIDCRPVTGCYAVSATAMWMTPGDRNAWTQLTPPDIGTLNALAVGDAGFVALAGTQGRVARWGGTSWTIDQLPTIFAIKLVAVASPTDIFALAESVGSLEEHQLFHWDGTQWSRVRSPAPALGSKIRQLWTDGRVTYLGGGAGTSTHFHALVRTEPW
jgi:hypothetical protein